MPEAPIILAFDTSAAHCAAALLSGDVVLAQAFEAMTKGQAERLMPLCQDVIETAGIAMNDLDAIGVGVGPGNFTGIRIAVSAARGLALGLDLPAIGVSTFEALHLGVSTPCIATVDARRERIYAQGFDLPGWETPRELDEKDLPTDIPIISEGSYPLAQAIARITAERFTTTSTRPAPFYLRPADAAPARDAPPQIIS